MYWHRRDLRLRQSPSAVMSSTLPAQVFTALKKLAGSDISLIFIGASSISFSVIIQQLRFFFHFTIISNYYDDMYKVLYYN
jgi:hypothetical protein